MTVDDTIYYGRWPENYVLFSVIAYASFIPEGGSKNKLLAYTLRPIVDLDKYCPAPPTKNSS